MVECDQVTIGTTWNDLYAHLVFNQSDTGKEYLFIVYTILSILKRYNEDIGDNHVWYLSKGDGINIDVERGDRAIRNRKLDNMNHDQSVSHIITNSDFA